MPNTNNIYIENGLAYKPDNCAPLITASKAGKLSMEAWGRLNYPGNYISGKALLKLNSIGYWDANMPQEWGLDWHRNEGLEITFLEKGNIPFRLENFHHLLESNELTFTRPWQPHKLGSPNINVSKLYWIILDLGVRHPHQKWIWPDWIMLTKADLDELTKMLRQNEQPVWKSNGELKRCFQKLGNLIKAESGVLNESMVIIYINEILVNLLELLRKGNIALNHSLIQGKRTVELFLNYLVKNLEEVWTVESMAAYCHMGSTQFTYYIKQITNATPIQYLTYMRIKAAAALIIEEPLTSIKNICYQCGFTSTEYFSVVFRKYYNSSPTEYRTCKASSKNRVPLKYGNISPQGV